MKSSALKRAKLRDLPEYGLFWSLATKRRGILLQWHRKKKRKWAAVCYFLSNEQFKSERKWVHAGTEVLVEVEDAVMNRNKRGDAGDPWKGRWEMSLGHARQYAKRAKKRVLDHEADQDPD